MTESRLTCLVVMDFKLQVAVEFDVDVTPAVRKHQGAILVNPDLPPSPCMVDDITKVAQKAVENAVTRLVSTALDAATSYKSGSKSIVVDRASTTLSEVKDE